MLERRVVMVGGLEKKKKNYWTLWITYREL